MPKAQTQKLTFLIDAENRAKAKFADAERQVKGFSNKIKSLQPTFRKMAVAGTIALGALAAGLGSSIKQAAKFEKLQVSFETMLGSADKAVKMMKDLQNFSATTPFQFDDISKSATQLLAFGVESDEIQNKLRFLGDIAAGANVPLTDMAAIFGKAKAKGKAMTEELLQLSDRGVPVIKVLAEQLKTTEGDIFELASQGKISFEIIQTALKSMSEEGGLFFDLMRKQSMTLDGRISTLKDNFTLLKAALGSLFLGQSGEIVVKMTAIVEKVKEWIKANPELAKTLIITGSAIIALATGLAILGIAIPAIKTAVLALIGPFGQWALILLSVAAAFLAIRDASKKEREETAKNAMAISESFRQVEEDRDRTLKGYLDAGDYEKYFEASRRFKERDIKDEIRGVDENIGRFTEDAEKNVFGRIFSGLGRIQSGEALRKEIKNAFTFNFSGPVLGSESELATKISEQINRTTELINVAGQ